MPPVNIILLPYEVFDAYMVTLPPSFMYKTDKWISDVAVVAIDKDLERRIMHEFGILTGEMQLTFQRFPSSITDYNKIEMIVDTMHSRYDFEDQILHLHNNKLEFLK